MVAFSQPANPARLPTPEPDGRPPQRCAVEAQGVPAKTAHLGSSPIKVGARAERGTREARADSRASYFNHKWPPEPISIPDLRVDFCGMPATFSV